MNTDAVFFFVVAGLAVISGIMMITRVNPVKSVLFLVVNFFCLAVLYLTLHAQFIAVIQIIVYAGAIMVLFLFVIMLLNLGDESGVRDRPGVRSIPAFALAVAVLVEVLAGIGFLRGGAPSAQSEKAAAIGTVEFIGRALYTEYLLPFEITSVLLLASMVGVIVLAKKKIG